MKELYDKLKRRTLMTQVGQGAVENLERAFGNGPQPVLHDLTGLDDGNFPIQQRQQPTVRRHKNAVEPDLIMTGARIGTINGSRRPRQGSGSSGGRNSPRYSNGSQDMFRTGSQQAAFFGMFCENSRIHWHFF